MPYLPGGCAQPDPAELQAWWQKLRTNPRNAALPDHYEVRWIGLDDETTEQVIELIVAGDKTGTFTLPWIVEHTDTPAPAPGDTIILVDFKGHPRLVVRLTEITEVAFGQITAEHTAIDGSPVRDLDVWIPLHTHYWNNLLAPYQLSVSKDMPVLVEKFELLCAEPEENYTLGYGEGALQWMTSRTAEVHGAFFLPYLKPDMRLLDCGCGPGTLTLGFAKRVAPGETIGIDREAAQFTETIQTAERENIANLRFEVGDIYELPYADESFDAVFASAVLGSVADPKQVVAEMARVLKPGGVMALKEFDHGGDIIWPQSEIIAQSINLYHGIRKHNGHAENCGRQLRKFMNDAGCDVDYLRAFFDQQTTTDELRAYIDRNNYLIGEILGQQYIQLGWCSQEELDAQAAAWVEFAADPAAIYLACWFEAAGSKR